MKTTLKVLGVTLLFGLPTIPLGRILWPDAPGGSALNPTDGQLALLIGISLFEALAFGLGVAFLIFGLPVMRRALGGGPLALLSWAAVVWLLASWWPHDNLHRVNVDIAGLIAIEYAFHTTLILAAALVAFSFAYLAVRAGATAPARAAQAEIAAPRLDAAVGR